MSHDSQPEIQTESQAESQPGQTSHTILFGPDGLRSGWGILLFLALFAAFLAAVGFVRHLIHPHAAKTAASAILTPRIAFYGELTPFLAICLATWIMAKIERRPFATYGFGFTDSRRNVPLLLAGLLWGTVFLSLLVILLLNRGLLVIDGRLLFGSDIWKYGLVWFICFVFVALFEETLTRGYLQYTLARGLASLYQRFFSARRSDALGFWTAAVLLSVLFGLGHGSNPGESPIGLLTAGLAAIVFCLSLWRTGSLWWAIGFHASWDWAQSFLYGVADSGTVAQHRFLATHPTGKPILSGGATGPEGSLFVLAILAIVAAVILFTLRKPAYQPNGIV